MKTTLLTRMLAITVLAFSSAAAEADVNQALMLNENLTANSNKQIVLVYYANETALTEHAQQNHDTIVGWLKSSESQDVRKMANSINDDRTEFANVVDQEVAAIKAASGQGNFGVVLLTNRMAQQNQFAYRTIGGAGFETAELAFPQTNDFVYSSHPLAHPASLPTALTAIAETFSPRTHQFVLITKSHGTDDRPFIPRLGVDASSTSKEKLIAQLLNGANRVSATKISVAAKKNRLGTGGNGNLGGKSKLLVGRFGTSKQQYVNALVTANQTLGMEFPLVFVEACQSELSDGAITQLRESVNILRTSDSGGLKYQTIDYANMFNNLDGSLVDALNRAIGE